MKEDPAKGTLRNRPYEEAPIATNIEPDSEVLTLQINVRTYSAVLILALALSWVVGPVVHEIRHAALNQDFVDARAARQHEHGDEPDVTEDLPEYQDGCTLCAVQIAKGLANPGLQNGNLSTEDATELLLFGPPPAPVEP